MPTGSLFSFSNPVSAERDRDYNTWYDQFHLPERLSVAGVSGITRYRIARLQPPGFTVPSQYLTVYEMDDYEFTMPRMMQAPCTLTDAVDMDNRLLYSFERISRVAR